MDEKCDGPAGDLKRRRVKCGVKTFIRKLVKLRQSRMFSILRRERMLVSHLEDEESAAAALRLITDRVTKSFQMSGTVVQNHMLIIGLLVYTWQ
jgi:hypothetical protein